MSQTQLIASYVSPTTTSTFSSALPAPPDESGTVEEKTAYLSALRAHVSKLQDDVNVFLTQKMEEDKAAAAAEGGTTGGQRSLAARDEKQEEEMYGEEDPEKDG